MSHPSLPVSIILENKLEIKNRVGNCPVGLMPCRPNVLSAKCLSVKGPVGQTSVGLVSVGQMSVGRTSGHDYCQWTKQRGKKS